MPTSRSTSSAGARRSRSRRPARRSRALAARGEVGPGRGDPAGHAAGQRRRQHVDPRLRPGRVPHRPGAIEAAALGPAAAPRPGRLPLQPGHRRRRRHHGRLRRRPPVDRGRAPRSSRRSRTSSGGDGIEFHPGVEYRHIMVAPADWADADVRAAPRPVATSRRCWPDRPGRPPSCSELMDASPRDRRPLRPRRPTRSGCGARASSRRCRSFSDALRARRRRWSRAVDLVRGLGVLTDIEVVDVEGATGWLRHRLRGASATPPSTRWPTAPTCSSSTSRPPTRPATPATSTRRSGPSRTGTARSSPAWSPASTRWARGGCCCCPTTPRRCGSRPTPPTRCPYLLVDSAVDGPGGTYTERGVADRRRCARPRAHGPPRPPLTTRRGWRSPSPAGTLAWSSFGGSQRRSAR